MANRTQVKPPIAKNHTAELKSSGIPDAMIVASGIYTEHNPSRVAEIIGWTPKSYMLPCMVIPFRDVDGTETGFARVKPARPRKNKEGKPVKYEQPLRIAARAYFPPGISTAATSSERIYITEGEKKTLSMMEHIGPTIGLCGVWNWCRKRVEGEDRQLIEDLAGIDWRGREVVIVFDADDDLKASVEYAQIELCRILEKHGAKTSIRTFEKLRVFGKGIDDILGIPDLRSEAVDLIIEGNSRHFVDMGERKRRSLKAPGIYFSDAGTGTGKSTTDQVLITGSTSSITCLPGHPECEEAEERYRSWGANARAYPKLDEKTCMDIERATRATKYGLSPALSVCPTCKFREQCDFRRLVAEAELADHQIATHHRIEITGGRCMENKQVVICHEKTIESMRPTTRIIRDNEDRVLTACDVVIQAMTLAERSYDGMKDIKQIRAWFAAAERTALWVKQILMDEADPILTPKGMGEPRGVMARIFNAIDSIMRDRGSHDYELREHERHDVFGDPLPDDWIEKKARSKQIAFFHYLADVVRVSIGNASAQFHTLQYLESPRRVVAERVVPLNPRQTTWLQDATTTTHSIRVLIANPLGLTVEHVGVEPQTQIHPIWQLVMDHGTPKVFGAEPRSRKGKVGITKGRDSQSIAEFVGGLLASLPESMLPAGVICHREHISAIREVGGDRLARTDNFHGATTRGSNVWMDPKAGKGKRCNCLIVAGTPRIAPCVVADRATQYIEDRAPNANMGEPGDDGGELPDYDQWAMEQAFGSVPPAWAVNAPDDTYTTRYWLGRDRHGRIVPVSYLGYADRLMDLAYRELVIAELRQAVGRARVCDPNGMPVIFLGNEPIKAWDFYDGEYGTDTSICIPGSLFLLTYPQLMHEGMRITKNQLVLRGLGENVARKIVRNVNDARKQPGSTIGWMEGDAVKLPWVSHATS